MDEQWKDVDGYEGLYQVSNKGRVRGLDRKAANGRRVKGVVLRPAPNSRGYLCVNLHNNGDGGHSYLVHRLVAQAFLPPSDKPQINHKNCDRNDNRAANLEWATALENIAHAGAHDLMPRGERHGRSKLTAADVRMIRAMRTAGVGRKLIASLFGIDAMYVYQIVTRQYWAHI